MTERPRSIFGQVKFSSPEVTKGQILPFLTFFYKSAHNAGTRRATVPQKSAFDSSLNILSLIVLRFDLRINSLASREETTINSRFFLQKGFFCNNFWLSKDKAFILPALYFFLQTSRMNYNMTLIGNFENLTSGQGHDLIVKDHVAYQLIFTVILNTAHLWCFNCSSWSL